MPIPQLTPFPDPPRIYQPEEEFDAKADEMAGHLPILVNEINAMSDAVNTELANIDDSVTAAANSATAAANSANDANTSKNAAADSATDAASSASSAASSKNAAQTAQAAAEVAASNAIAANPDKFRLDFLRRAQQCVSTAAMIEIIGTSIKFQPSGANNFDRIFVIGAGKGANSLSSGFVNINPPAPGAAIYGLGTANVTVDSNGFIPVPAYGTLWYKMPPAGSTLSTQGEWWISGYTGDYSIPDDFLFICQHQPDSVGGMMRMFDGRQLFAGKNYADTGWIDMSLYLASGVTAYGGSLEIPRFRRLNNRVYVEGLVNTSTTAFTGLLATLPPQYRPKNTHILQSTGQAGFARLDVRADGTLDILSNSSSEAWLSLEFNFGLG